ncbi:MAG: adenylosuccinate lyase [Chloroflexota bacterium]
MDFDYYQSPFSWRYGSSAMRAVWSESQKRRLWRKMWVALAEVQSEYQIVMPEQLADLKAHAEEIDVPRALEIEAEIHHDLMAEIKTFAEQAKIGGGVLHLGATSMDIEDNAEALRIRESLVLIIEQLKTVLSQFSEKIIQWSDLPIIAQTHIQPAEPSTLGYRLAQYAQDLLADFEAITQQHAALKGKGFKGAVGTGASYSELIGVENLPKFETRLSEILDLPFYPVTSQTYPRKQEYQVINSLAGLGASVYKFAFDMRILQSPPFGELSEGFKKKQVGSSAMPFKRNPIQAEKINSLGRYLAQLPRVAWDNAAHSLLERTLDDSANRRSMLPEAFLICDELLKVTGNILKTLVINEAGIQKNLRTYGPFAATERVLMALGKKGADRQEMHERIREHSLAAWEAMQQVENNPLVDMMQNDEAFTSLLSEDEITKLMNADAYVGDAPQRAVELAKTIQIKLAP